MKIAIVDSGIDINHPRLKNASITGISIKECNLNNIEIKNDYLDTQGHGTGIASIIHKLSPKSKLVIVKIFHNSLISSEDIVCHAIDWCIQQANIKLINLSLGLQSDIVPGKLQKICREAFKKNIILISSAYTTLSKPCYPAYFNEVFGVTEGKLGNKYSFGRLIGHPIEFIAKGDMQRIASINNGFKFTNGTSYACAHFTGIVANILENDSGKKHWDVPRLKQYLYTNADKEIKPSQQIKSTHSSPQIISCDLKKVANSLFNRDLKFGFLNNAAIFPLSEKEMNTFLGFSQQCTFQITKYFDYPRNLTKSRINDIEVQDWFPNEKDFEDFDSLIIGYYHEHLFQANVDFGNRLIEKCLTKNKNLFIFDLVIYNEIKNLLKNLKSDSKIYCPAFTIKEQHLLKTFKYLPQIKVPTLAIIGTSNRQGKFTTQLRIKQILSHKGYDVRHISTEPHGELFGADICFPIGHNPTVTTPQTSWGASISEILKALEYYRDPDIIITGIQGWAVPPVFGNDERDFDKLQFISGFKPDAVICAINPNDTAEIIEKNITAIEIITNCKLLFFVMTPWLREVKQTKTGSFYDYRMLPPFEYQQKLDFYSNQLGSDVIDILDTNNDKFIVEKIEDFYS